MIRVMFFAFGTGFAGCYDTQPADGTPPCDEPMQLDQLEPSDPAWTEANAALSASGSAEVAVADGGIDTVEVSWTRLDRPLIRATSACWSHDTYKLYLDYDVSIVRVPTRQSCSMAAHMSLVGHPNFRANPNPLDCPPLFFGMANFPTSIVLNAAILWTADEHIYHGTVYAIDAAASTEVGQGDLDDGRGTILASVAFGER